jgi:phosphatidylglycerophosphate synthase
MTDGERWTQDVLRELREGRFAPAAWRRFLAASFGRAREQRRIHGRAHGQVLALAAAGLAGWALALIAGRPMLALAGVVWWVVLLLMLDWHLGMLERADGSRLDGLGMANAVTAMRGGAIPAFAALDRPGLLVGLAAFATLDVVDGFLARRRDERTRLGAWLDGSLDSVAAVVVIVFAQQLGAVPAWLTFFVLLRVVAPWLVLAVAYFVSPRSLPWQPALRAPGLAARLPASLAAVGVGMSLAGAQFGVSVAATGVGASLILLTVLVARQIEASGAPNVAG